MYIRSVTSPRMIGCWEAQPNSTANYTPDGFHFASLPHDTTPFNFPSSSIVNALFPVRSYKLIYPLVGKNGSPLLVSSESAHSFCPLGVLISTVRAWFHPHIFPLVPSFLPSFWWWCVAWCVCRLPNVFPETPHVDVRSLIRWQNHGNIMVENIAIIVLFLPLFACRLATTTTILFRFSFSSTPPQAPPTSLSHPPHLSLTIFISLYTSHISARTG